MFCSILWVVIYRLYIAIFMYFLLFCILANVCLKFCSILYVVCGELTCSADWSFSNILYILYIVCTKLYNVPSFWSIFRMFSVVCFTMCWIWYVVYPMMQFVDYSACSELYIVCHRWHVVHCILYVEYCTFYNGCCVFYLVCLSIEETFKFTITYCSRLHIILYNT